MIIKVLLVSGLLFMPLSTLHAAEAVSIGVVLPLSGKFAAFGNKALQGVELAIEKYNSTDAAKKRPVSLIIKDTLGSPESAEKAVSELDREDVGIIIGPLLGATAEAAAKKAQQIGIPLITMTQKDGIAETGDWVFRNCVTNQAQVKSLVKHAITEGLKRVVVLFPDNAYGKEMTSLFAAEIDKLGGEIANAQSYKEAQTDFGHEIKAIAGPDFLKAMNAYHEEKEKEFREAEKARTDGRSVKKKKAEDTDKEIERPRPDFDAVFIPDLADRIVLIIPQLAYYDITGVKLLGLSGWNSPKLVKFAGEFLNDSIFLDGFFTGSERPHVRAFVEMYKTTFGEEPGILEAQAYDTAGIALSILPSTGSSREEIKNGLSRVRDYHGVTGDITFSGREAERSFFVLTGANGRIEELPSP